METQSHIEVIAVQDLNLAAALMSYGHVPLTLAKTQKGTMQHAFGINDEVREYLKQHDSKTLLVPVSYPEAIDVLMNEPYYWQ